MTFKSVGPSIYSQKTKTNSGSGLATGFLNLNKLETKQVGKLVAFLMIRKGNKPAAQAAGADPSR